MEVIAPILVLAFFCELVDSSLGMGYGTTLTPLLLVMGYTPAEVVPAVLLSECITGTLAGVLHHEFGNVELRPGARDFKVALVLTGFSLLGVGVAVNISAWAVKVYVGLLVLGIGLSILRNHR